ncbi:MAG: hypothetical protein A3K61_05675 [Thaumarchaeota archaeon RBG_16_49_8]|nr:MAG: hypothetical protein A3K61_05675 [Thaumarchaeota archaeon RBG_16_49_8]
MDTGTVLTFGSLQDLSDFLEEDIERSKRMITSYNERLGVLLRSNEPKDAPKKAKQGEQGGRWIPYGRLMLYGGASRRGEAEMLFETVDELKTRVRYLEEARQAAGNLSKVGLGEAPIYLVQFKTGLPHRVVVLNPTESDRPKLKFEGELVIRPKSRPVTDQSQQILAS